MDEDQLTPQIIEQLIKYMPQPAQMSQLAELKAEYKTMAEPEQFGVVVSTAHIHTRTHILIIFSYDPGIQYSLWSNSTVASATPS